MIKRQKLFLCIAGIVISVLSLLVSGTLLSAATPKVTVFVFPQKITQNAGTTCSVAVSVNDVTNLNRFSFSLTYDPSVMRIPGEDNSTGVSAGIIIDSSVSPVQKYSIPIIWHFAATDTQGSINVSGNLKAATDKGANGDGSLIIVKFELVGDIGATSNVTLSNMVLRQQSGSLLTIEKIVNGSVSVAYPPVVISIDAPSALPAGDNFTADINVNIIQDISAFQFDIKYDPNKLRVLSDESGEGVRGGYIGSTDLPVYVWMYHPVGTPGVIRVLGGTLDGSTVTGSGTLASIDFESLGNKGETTNLVFVNTCSLYRTYKDISGVTWNNTSVEFLGSYRIVNSSPLITGEVGLAYSRTLAAIGGEEPYTFTVQSSNLPGGLKIDPEGEISGVPTTPVNSVGVVFKVTDKAGNSVTKTLKMTMVAPPQILSDSALTQGEISVAYTQTFTSSLGLTPHTWTLKSGHLPAGLALSTAGVLNGIPLESGDFNFTVQITDKLGGTASLDCTLQIASQPIILNTSPLASAEIGSAYSNTLQISGGVSPCVWSVYSGTLPAGLTLDSTTGTISGTPTKAGGPYTITFKAVDKLLVSATKALSFTVVNRPTVSSSFTLPNGETGVTYSSVLIVNNGLSPYTWSITTGTLPVGLTLSSNGIISGTPTTIKGATLITFKVTDSAGATATRALSITIIRGLSIVSNSPLADGKAGSAYSQLLTATGGLTPYTWSVRKGSLPTGLTLNTTSGAIIGTPGVLGTFPFTVMLSDSLGSITKDFSITIAPPPTIVTEMVLNEGEVNLSYSQTLIASNGSAPYKWAIASGSLPSGLSLGVNTGMITGKPKASGTKSFTLKVTDSASGSMSKVFTITVVNAVSISNTTVSSGETGLEYLLKMNAAGGKTPYVWSISSGALPSGLNLNANSGVISGTPTASGKFKVKIQVTDGFNAAATKSYTFGFIPGVKIMTKALADGEEGLAYTTKQAVSGGKTPYRWDIFSGELPPGLTINVKTGTISGNPASDGTFDFKVRVTDALGGYSTAAFELIISPGPQIETVWLPDGKVKQAYYQTLTASGGITPYKWSIGSGKLPNGLKLNASSGVISGTPTAAFGPTSIKFKVTDKMKAVATQTIKLTIMAPPGITTTSLSSGKVGRAYSRNLVVTGGQAPYQWIIQSGSLPVGLSLDTDSGNISGKPASAGKYIAIFKVTDSLGDTATKKLTITITK